MTIKSKTVKVHGEKIPVEIWTENKRIYMQAIDCRLPIFRGNGKTESEALKDLEFRLQIED